MRSAIEHGQEFEGALFEGVDLSEVHLSETRFEACRFLGCDLRRSTWSAAFLSSCTFEDCDLSGAQLGRSTTLREVRLAECALVGVRWEARGAMTARITLERCDLRRAAFVGADLRGARFVDCRCVELHLEESDLRGAAFPGSRLEGAICERCDLRGTDLSDARGYLFLPELNKTGETRYSLDGGRNLLAHLGIELPALGSD